MSNKEQIQTINPTTEEVIKTYQLMTEEDAIAAVKKCHQAFKDWKHKSLSDRAQVIKAIGKELSNRKDDLAKLMTEEMGKLIKQGEQEIDLCSALCDYTASEGQEELKDKNRELPEGGKGIIQYAPIGVIYGIQPWNFPTYQVIRYAIANLMAGNAVLLKHAENVTGSALMIKEILEDAGLPKDLFTVLIISHEVSNKIIEHDLVRGVTLTGSSGAGKKIAKRAGEALKKTVLELGSNDAYLVLEDADLDLAVETCIKGRIYNNGETCVAAKRFIVVESVYEDFKEGFVKGMKDINYGNPTKEDSKMGPMARKDLREQLHKQVEESVSKGAEILCGGKMPDGTGFYYPSTVLGNVKPGQPAYDDELFGPVASLIKAKDADDAMRIANDSRFGLGGGIFSKNEDKAIKLAKDKDADDAMRIANDSRFGLGGGIFSKNEDKAIKLAKDHFDTGMVFINSFGLAQPNMPFGGVKNSGYGREHGGFGIKEFVNEKAIMNLN